MTDRTDDFKFIASALPPPARVSPPPPKVRQCICVCVPPMSLLPLSKHLCVAPDQHRVRFYSFCCADCTCRTLCCETPVYLLYEDNTWSVSIATSTGGFFQEGSLTYVLKFCRLASLGLLSFFLLASVSVRPLAGAKTQTNLSNRI